MFQQASAYRATWNVFKEAGNVLDRICCCCCVPLTCSNWPVFLQTLDTGLYVDGPVLSESHSPASRPAPRMFVSSHFYRLPFGAVRLA